MLSGERTRSAGGFWFDAHSAFRAGYARLRERSRVDLPGVIVAAFDVASAELVGHRGFEATPGRPVRTDVGASWRWDGAPAELAIFLAPVTTYRGGGVCARAIAIPGAPDLRDESSTIVSAIESTRTMLLYREGLAFLVLPTGDPTDWPASSRAAWAWLAPRPPEARWVLADGSRQLAGID